MLSSGSRPTSSDASPSARSTDRSGPTIARGTYGTPGTPSSTGQTERIHFFAWARGHHASVDQTRSLLASAFGYVIRQEPALRRFLDDGRLPLTNNASERALRTIAVGRKNWLFCGSDDHATAAANLFSLIVSCQLHQLDAETYLGEIFRVLPYWPRTRFLELAPKYWAATRARLDSNELARHVGHVTVPAPTAK